MESWSAESFSFSRTNNKRLQQEIENGQEGIENRCYKKKVI